MRTSVLSALSLVALTSFGLFALGSKSSDKTSTTDPAASGSAAAASGKAGSAGGGKQEVLATCNVKSLGKCSENYGMVPTLAADLCKGEEGVFTKGSTPCPADGVIGTCDFKPKNAGDPGEIHYYYSNSVGDPKGSCEALGAAWTAKAAAPTATAAASAAASGATAAATAAAATGATPAKSAAAPAKSAAPAGSTAKKK